MKRLQQLGIRFPTDAEQMDSDFLISSLEILEGLLSETGERFFLESCEVDQYEFGGVKCQDLIGWIVGSDMIGSFEPRWLAGENADELGDFDTVLVTWREGADGKPEPVIDRGELWG